MFKPQRLLAAVGLCLALAGAPALAQAAQYPEGQTPALSYDLPAGWRTEPGDGLVILKSGDGAAFVILAVYVGADAGEMSDDQVASAIVAEMGVGKAEPSRAVTLSGQPARVYDYAMSDDAGGAVRVIVSRPKSDRVAIVVRATGPQAPQATQDAADNLVYRVGFVGF